MARLERDGRDIAEDRVGQQLGLVEVARRRLVGRPVRRVVRVVGGRLDAELEEEVRVDLRARLTAIVGAAAARAPCGGDCS